ncbi:MAG: hypothetical protein IBJ02_08970 [Brevundimonas sp.]|nr:hypothetical protein [Brevundimonas sp.]
MNFLTILRSVEDLLYEVMSWLLFYPRTLWMTLTHPLKTMKYSDQEQQDKPEKQYLETLSPPLFLVLSLLLAHAVEIAIGLGDETGRGRLARIITQNDQTLLGFRALMFSLHAIAFAWVALRLEGKRVDRDSLRAPFFAQCYLSGATTILISLGSIGIRYPGDAATLTGFAVIAVTTVWYLAVQWNWLKRRLGLHPWRAAFATFATYGVTTGCIFFAGALSI